MTRDVWVSETITFFKKANEQDPREFERRTSKRSIASTNGRKETTRS